MDSGEMALWILVAFVVVAVVMGVAVVFKKGLLKSQPETSTTTAEPTTTKADTPAPAAVESEDPITTRLRLVNNRAREAAGNLTIAHVELWTARDEQRAAAMGRRAAAMNAALDLPSRAAGEERPAGEEA